MAEVDVVISGGSVEGVCTATGFLKAVTEDLGHKIVSAAGNSAGGVVLGLHASGKSASEIEEMVLGTNFESFISLPRWYNFIKIYRAFRRGWLSDGNKFMRFLELATGQKNFNEVNFDLHLAGSDFTNFRLVDLNKHRNPDMPLALAIRITACLPAAFKPVNYNNTLWYDGGVRRHYPVDLVPESKRPFFGWLVGSLEIGTPTPVETRPGILGLISDYIEQSVDNNVQDSISCSTRRPVTISYDDIYVHTFSFDIDRSEKERLIRTARESTLKSIK